jgi:hypothetical protein
MPDKWLFVNLTGCSVLVSPPLASFALLAPLDTIVLAGAKWYH